MTGLTLKMDNRKTTALYYIGAVGAVFAMQNASAGWLTVAVMVHVLVISLFSAITHRYFCHQGYQANPTVMWLLSFIPVAYGYSTPAGWSALHAAHHAFADTDKDTHLKGWAGLLTANYRMPPLKFALTGRWFHGRGHSFLHNNAMGVVIVWNLLLALVSVDALLWIGLVPIFTLHFFNGLHRVFSHQGLIAKNRWYLEYLFPMGGEWIHDEHHVNPRKSIFRNRWYELDTGALFVKILARQGDAQKSPT